MEKRIKRFWVAGFFLPAINATVFRKSKIADVNSLFFKVASATAPIAPVLNRPLDYLLPECMSKPDYGNQDFPIGQWRLLYSNY